VVRRRQAAGMAGVVHACLLGMFTMAVSVAYYYNNNCRQSRLLLEHKP